MDSLKGKWLLVEQEKGSTRKRLVCFLNFDNFMEKLTRHLFGISFLFAALPLFAQEPALRYPDHKAICDRINKDFGNANTMRWQAGQLMDFMSTDAPYVTSGDERDSSASPIKGYRECSGSQRGVASVYGIPGRDTFAGKKTASGETMRPDKYRAAILNSAGTRYPLGTWVRVKKGDQSVLVCINDRGGGKKGRVIDLTPASARAINNGDLGNVTVECVMKPINKRSRCDDAVGDQIADNS